MAEGVRTKNKLYASFYPKWQRVRDVIAGQDAIHAAGPLYLPTLAEQSNLEYLAYVQRAPFYNASWRTVAGFVGMLFRKPPTTTVPEPLKKLLDDVTMSGVPFETFAQNVALETLSVSRVGIMVDFPQAVAPVEGETVTIAKAESMALRPMMQMFKTESIINWQYSFIGNRNVLTQVRLAETANVKESEFVETEEKRIRVLDLFNGAYRIRVFKEESETQIGGDVTPTMNGQPLDFIPFYFIGPDGIDGNLEEPILIDLFDLNIKHYQVSADHAQALHMLVPTPWVTGYQSAFGTDGVPIKENFYIGSTTAWVFPDANTKVGYLEFSGAGLSAYDTDLARKEGQMAAIGARMLAPEKAGVEAEGTLAMRHSGENSILAAIAVAVSQGLTEALKTFAAWANQKGECKFEINREFIPLTMDAQKLTALMAVVQSGNMSKENFFNLQKRADLIDSDITYEDEQARIDAEPPPTPEPLIVGKPTPKKEEIKK